MKIQKLLLLICAFSFFSVFASANDKSKLTLDEFFNSVSFPAVSISPDGNSVVIVTERADWDQKIFRKDLWLYREGGTESKDGAKPGSLIQLTQSGHDSDPKWSPDGRWIAFLSERKSASGKDFDSDSDDDKGDVGQLYVISPSGGEAIQLTEGQADVHTMTWSTDSRTLYFAVRQPWNKQQKDAYKEEWKDVVQYRAAERGDTIFALDLGEALARNYVEANKQSTKEQSEAEKESDQTPGARAVATLPLRIEDLTASPDGSKLAFVSNAINQRQEKYEDVEIYEVNLNHVEGRAPSPAGAGSETSPVEAHRLTRNQAVENHIHWAPDSRHIFFTVEVGDVAGSYRDLQPHLYWVDAESGAIEQWAKDFPGEIISYGPYGNGAAVAARLGTEVQMYVADTPSSSLKKVEGYGGNYDRLSTPLHSLRVAFVYSALQKPEEVYIAEGPNLLQQARAITSFNKQLADSDLPQGKPYKWKADDGTTVEGMLIYPPGKFEAKHLPMFTFIHGGPADAWGNSFEADWYQYGSLAATNGWLVFEPNYRGSSGYGEKFLMQIVPQIVSRPGKDILEGVDSLVKDGIADSDRLVVGGYSYGGYMTNWLITQTTRFKAAVTGAGAVEHVGNWGNDDTTYDDAYFLGGRPWEAQQRYHDEAAIFQIDKVKTPTHIVAGADDIRVAVLEDYLLEHALYSLGVPNALLIFPGEGHSLDKNPWHGKIKVREELKWLGKYGGVQ